MTEQHFLRGAFVVYPPRASLQEPPQFIPFRFNPETLSRSLKLGVGSRNPGTKGSTSEGSSTASEDVAADAALGPLTESFAVKVRIDLDDRQLTTQLLPRDLGISPELAALELLVQPAESIRDAILQASKGVASREERPTVLFVWGRLRVLPVRITSMDIEETLFNAELHPTRAEVNVHVEVLNGIGSQDPVVKAALTFTQSKRQALGRLFHAASAAQGANVILPL